MGRSRRGRVASGGGASSVVGERGTIMTEKINLYLYLYLVIRATGGIRLAASGPVCICICISSLVSPKQRSLRATRARA